MISESGGIGDGAFSWSFSTQFGVSVPGRFGKTIYPKGVSAPGPFRKHRLSIRGIYAPDFTGQRRKPCWMLETLLDGPWLTLLTTKKGREIRAPGMLPVWTKGRKPTQ